MKYSQIKQAVIFAGGLGTRMRPLTLTTPKPMIKIQEVPFLEYIIKLLVQNNIKEVIVLVGYLHEQIENYFGDGKKFGIKIKYSYSPVDAETGTRLKNANKLLAENFLLLYGDNYWSLNIEKLIALLKRTKRKNLVTVYSNLDNSTKNNMLVNNNGLVEVYDKSRKREDLNGVDIGFFILEKKVLKLIPRGNSSFEKIVIPELIKKKQLAGYLTDHKYYGLSNLQRIPIIKNYFKPKKVVFLDRDGTINVRPKKAEYVTDWKNFIFLPEAKKALKLLTKNGYSIFIVSNQPGIARKMVKEKEVEKIHRKLIKELKKIGVKIEKIYICPHGWDEGCFCRKPNPGMFFQAASENGINLFKSYCIGDDPRDIMAGNRAGCKTIFVSKNYRKQDFKQDEIPNFFCHNLYEAAKKIITK